MQQPIPRRQRSSSQTQGKGTASCAPSRLRRADGLPVGVCGPALGHGSFRIALVPDATDRGIGSEATRLLLDYAFERVRLHRVQLEVFDYNPRARRAYEKCGFEVEGRMREALYWDGARHDVLVMAALRPGRARGRGLRTGTDGFLPGGSGQGLRLGPFSRHSRWCRLPGEPVGAGRVASSLPVEPLLERCADARTRQDVRFP
ncbi:GNAT family N-acetyltransferase [Streptomyces tubercidicus]|uniref:GNAT family N-acetyltransferase n=1 Tax=Streptomyces tubercidicus TaxID=47759 RepID=UPI0036CA0D44